VRPAHRGGGVGRLLVEAMIDVARAAGYRTLCLDTLPSMASAQALYQSLGFLQIPAYNIAHLPGTRFYSLDLRRDLR
jgi:ribosomal protein S18 acetylase RimI-like enzyme